MAWKIRQEKLLEANVHRDRNEGGKATKQEVPVKTANLQIKEKVKETIILQQIDFSKLKTDPRLSANGQGSRREC